MTSHNGVSTEEIARLVRRQRAHWHDTSLVFTTKHGADPDAANVRKLFKRVWRAAGVGDSWTPRELRTSFVSLMSHNGVSTEEIEVVYRRELRPVITTGPEIMDKVFKAS